MNLYIFKLFIININIIIIFNIVQKVIEFKLNNYQQLLSLVILLNYLFQNTVIYERNTAVITNLKIKNS